MHASIDKLESEVTGIAACGFLPGGVVSALMHPLDNVMNPLHTMISRGQKDTTWHGRDLMHEMIAALHQIPDRTAHVDMGGKDKRPGDLAMHFDPKMDQDIKFYTGRGDDMVIIV